VALDLCLFWASSNTNHQNKGCNKTLNDVVNNNNNDNNLLGLKVIVFPVKIINNKTKQQSPRHDRLHGKNRDSSNNNALFVDCLC
jgi:hypothetical protein